MTGSYSYLALFLLVGLESLGLPLPGETALVTAAAFAALGHLSIYGVVATAVAAAVIGDNGGYWIGRTGGIALVRRYGRFLHLNEAHLERARHFFARHGPPTVFIGRFVALLRTWTAVLAGAARMPYGRFMLYNSLGAVCWAGGVGALGYMFGRNLPRLEQYMGQASLAGALLVALIVGLVLGWRWFERNRTSLVARTQHWWTFAAAHFARGEYLGLHLTIGLAISLAGLWLFAAVTEDVIHHDPLTQFDVALLRTWTAVLAGAARMPYGRFMLYNALGAVCWTGVVSELGYVFGRNLPRLEHYMGQASLAGALLVALIVGLVLGWRWFERNRTRLVTRTEHLRMFAAARFARGEYLGLHLTIGLAVSLAGLWLFAAVTEDVIHHDPLTQFDVALLDWLHAHATPTGYAVFNTISSLGSAVTLTILALAVGCVLAARREWILLAGWLAAFAGGGLLDVVLKLVIRRPRPPGAAAFLQHFSWSFPSGHAMASLVGYGMLAYVLTLLWIHRRSAQIAVVLGAALLIIAIGFSRLYLGVHYFSDVAGGYAAGVLWLSACISGVDVARRWRRNV